MYNSIAEYPWLKSPPQLELSDFKSLKLKIDFNSENIQGSSNVNSVYYQIIFKVNIIKHGYWVHSTMYILNIHRLRKSSTTMTNIKN